MVWSHGGLFISVPDPNPSSVAIGVQKVGWGGGFKKMFGFWGAFLTCLFHSEHFECTQVGIHKPSFTRHHK